MNKRQKSYGEFGIHASSVRRFFDALQNFIEQLRRRCLIAIFDWLQK